MGELASTYILPPAIKYQNILIANIKGLKELGFDESAYSSQLQIAQKISEHVDVIGTKVKEMIEARKVANNIENSRERAIKYCDEVKKHFDVIRYHVDKLELLIDDELWELPRYRELLFLR
jgi:glutamine synthetase